MFQDYSRGMPNPQNGLATGLKHQCRYGIGNLSHSVWVRSTASTVRSRAICNEVFLTECRGLLPAPTSLDVTSTITLNCYAVPTITEVYKLHLATAPRVIDKYPTMEI